jgi:NAD(P)-dependent dehydrogenase (short-subunit alcohol dehydrogenase family)
VYYQHLLAGERTAPEGKDEQRMLEGQNQFEAAMRERAVAAGSLLEARPEGAAEGGDKAGAAGGESATEGGAAGAAGAGAAAAAAGAGAGAAGGGAGGAGAAGGAAAAGGAEAAEEVTDVGGAAGGGAVAAGSGAGLRTPGAGSGARVTSYEMTQLAYVEGDDMADSEEFPEGALTVNGQQVDCRKTNSWTMKLADVSTPEMAEVFAINAIAPAVLNAKLKPLMARNKEALKFIVNVSAMEGKFYRFKQATHPHTNMAKAALNMMTRTSAQDYVKVLAARLREGACG